MTIIEKIRVLISRKDKTLKDFLVIPPSSNFPNMENFDFPYSVHIFLIGFSYDTPTKQTISWIKNILSNSPNQEKIHRFHSDDFKRADLIAPLNKKFKRVEIFCGHGANEGLYGPPYNEINPDFFKDIHSIIYDVGMISEGPSSMFAFCCNAARKFGRAFASLKGNSFIGFDDSIPFPKELYEDLRYIFQKITKDIIQKGKIEEKHREMFVEEIDILIDDINRYKHPDKIGLHLLEYRNLFKAYI